ncbi:hypothetical protein RUM43_005362 [Polyplax serrata]|uniref:Symplekin n=1 Tax=Polyplax serrata TaxID=468196 RepID=A0AAN8PWT4_POLSC
MARDNINSPYYEDNGEGAATYNKIVEWLNEAALSTESSVKVDNLRKVQEIIFNSAQSSLLDNFLHEVLVFQTDRNADVRKLIIGFIEEACKKDPDILPKVVMNINLLLQDNSAQVQKRVIQAAGPIYKVALKWLAKAKSITEEMEAAWKLFGQIKQQIINMIDNDNDGIRTLAVKFLEFIVLLQTYPEVDGLPRESDFSLEDIPFTLKIARRRKLEEEAQELFQLLIKFHGSPHISSVNLMTCMGSLVLIAKLRPQLMGKVVTALESLHINLPPTLSKSQVSSVRKHLKLQLLNLLKLPTSIDFHNNITTLLTDLGATYQEVLKAYPKADDIRKYKQKRSQETSHSDVPMKKMKMDQEFDDNEPETEYGENKRKSENAVDITEKFIAERLTAEFATQLVMLSMAKLPEIMPPHFSSTYTPIAAAGTKGQIRHVARLMATQLTAINLGPGVKLAKKTIKAVIEDDDEEMQYTKTLVPSTTGDVKKVEEKGKTTLVPAGSKQNKLSRLKTLKLQEITKPLKEEVKNSLMVSAFEKILEADKAAVDGGVSATRTKIITFMASTFSPQLRAATLNYIKADIKSRIDLGISWLYEEYSFMQGFNRFPFCLKQDKKPDENYNNLLHTIINEVMFEAKLDLRDREVLLNRLYLEVPLITDDAMDLLKDMCCDEVKAPLGLKLLEDLIVKRPPRQMNLLNALLVHTSHENLIIRSEALTRVVSLYNRKDLSNIIEEYSVFYLGFLKLPLPPDVLFGNDRGRPEKTDAWTEETIKACLYLLMALLPINEKMIHELARVYVATAADVKRTIIRLLEQPVRGMGMNSPELLLLVEQCPKGAETLVTRVIHVLTDKVPPSAELVERVRDLYRSRVSDVRFLIPVLNGLKKEEVIDALPKLIKLNPIVVKEVFNRLLGTHSETTEFTSPITPAELLIALHTIDPSKCELKIVIKATSLCFAERQVYTQETLAVVLQQLMEINPLPTLLMRTVIQSLTIYPRLIGFVMNILQRLILKQVWKQKKVWEGFIKCCQRTKPQSFQVLLQLPAPQLAEVFKECPDIRNPLLDHVMTFTEHQRKHIQKNVMDLLLGNQTVIIDDDSEYVPPPSVPELIVDIKKEPVDPSEPPPPGIISD